MTTTRCNAEERKAFRERYAAERRKWGPYSPTAPEPALGTLDQRLDIIIQRLGGNVRTPKPQPWERELFPVERAS